MRVNIRRSTGKNIYNSYNVNNYCSILIGIRKAADTCIENRTVCLHRGVGAGVGKLCVGVRVNERKKEGKSGSWRATPLVAAPQVPMMVAASQKSEEGNRETATAPKQSP